MSTVTWIPCPTPAACKVRYGHEPGSWQLEECQNRRNARPEVVRTSPLNVYSAPPQVTGEPVEVMGVYVSAIKRDGHLYYVMDHEDSGGTIEVDREGGSESDFTAQSANDLLYDILRRAKPDTYEGIKYTALAEQLAGPAWTDLRDSLYAQRVATPSASKKKVPAYQGLGATVVDKGVKLDDEGYPVRVSEVTFAHKGKTMTVPVETAPDHEFADARNALREVAKNSPDGQFERTHDLLEDFLGEDYLPLMDDVVYGRKQEKAETPSRSAGQGQQGQQGQQRQQSRGGSSSGSRGGRGRGKAGKQKEPILLGWLDSMLDLLVGKRRGKR